MSQTRLWAAVDQGSTSTKGALVDESGQSVYETGRRVSRKVDGDSVTQDPVELATSVERTLDKLLRRAPKGSVQGIGLTCQRSTCLLWDRQSGEALTSALSWQDTSQASQARKLAPQEALVRRRTGLPLSPHYAALKLGRLISDLPHGKKRAETGTLVAGTLDAFLTRRLVGRDLTEPGHAGRSLCFNLARGSWDEDLCRLFRIPRSALPTIAPSAGARGTFRGVELTAVAGDQQAALLGHGGWRPGVTAAHFGTGAFVLASTGNRVIRNPRLLSAALATTPRARRYQLEGSVNSAGSSVDWIFRVTGQRIEAWQEQPIEPGSLPAVLPAFAGLATPWWRPEARAVLAGIDTGMSADDLISGTLFALAMRVLDCVEALERAGVRTRVLRLSGKLTRLRGLVALLANAGRRPVEVSTLEETGIAGIARLAAAGASGRASPLEHTPTARARIEPAWPEAEALSVRRKWRAFVRKALAVADARPF